MKKKKEWKKPELVEIVRGTPDVCTEPAEACKHDNQVIVTDPDDVPGGCTQYHFNPGCTDYCKGYSAA